MRQKNLVYLQQYSHLLIINIKKKKKIQNSLVAMKKHNFDLTQLSI